MSSNAESVPADVILSIDLGSTWCKAAFIDVRGRLLAEGRATTLGHGPGGEALLNHHWGAFARSVRAVTQAYEGEHGNLPRISAINFCTRGLIGIAFDEHDQPFVLAENPNLIAKFRDTSSMTGSAWERDDESIRYGYASRLGSLLEWVFEHDRETFLQIRRIGGLRDWIAFLLTGNWVTDHTMGPGQSEWPPDLISRTNLPESAFAEILGPMDVAGTLLDEPAAHLGLDPGIPVVAGLHDGSAANIGVGAINPGQVCLTLGTNLSLRAVNGERLPGAFCYVILPERWAWVDNAPNAAGRLDRAARLLAVDGETLPEAHARLGQWARRVDPGCNGFRLPGLPVRNTDEFGEALEAERSSGVDDPVLYRAVVEQIAFEVGWLLARARRSGARPERFIATGGGLRNDLLCAVLSAVLGSSIERGEQEAGLLGAAVTAAAALGWYPSTEHAVAAMVRHGQSVQPDVDLIAQYGKLWLDWAKTRPGSEILL